jgi:hypothetical protein
MSSKGGAPWTVVVALVAIAGRRLARARLPAAPLASVFIGTPLAWSFSDLPSPRAGNNPFPGASTVPVGYILR